MSNGNTAKIDMFLLLINTFCVSVLLFLTRDHYILKALNLNMGAAGLCAPVVIVCLCC